MVRDGEGIMADLSPIPEDRPLTSQEASLVRWLLEHAFRPADAYLAQLNDARVSSRCACGCASVDFAIGGVVPTVGGGIGLIADFDYPTDQGHCCGVFVFERAGLLAGLEVYSADGLSNPPTLPVIDWLR
jgi:hypothetical protein